MNTRKLNPEGRKLESQASFARQKKEDKDLVSQVQFQIEALTSKFVLIVKNLEPNPQKFKEEVQLPILKNQPEADKMEIEKNASIIKKFTSSVQQNVVITVKRLDIYGGNVRSEKECLSSTEKNLEHQRDCIVIALEIFKGRSWFQQQQNRQLQKDNNDLRIYLDQLEKNYTQMEEQFYQLIEEKEELSQFEIDSDEDMYS